MPQFGIARTAAVYVVTVRAIVLLANKPATAGLRDTLIECGGEAGQA